MGNQSYISIRIVLDSVGTPCSNSKIFFDQRKEVTIKIYEKNYTDYI